MLKIALRHGERVVINGAVIAAEGRAALLVENAAAVLRAREVMHAEEATTPARQLYFALQMAYLDPAARDTQRDVAAQLLGLLVDAFVTENARALCAACAAEIAAGGYYRALGLARRLIAAEDAALARLAA